MLGGMNRTPSVVRALVTVLVAAATLVVGAASASAAPSGATWAVDSYSVCADPDCYVLTYGTVVWANRTATVDGTVSDLTSSGIASVHFDAFASTTKVDSETIDYVLKPGEEYTFVIGDPNRVGGIDRVRVQVCWRDSRSRECGPQVNMSRN
jgi:hypothetical protein